MIFVIYDSTGVIKRIGTCPAIHVAAQVQPGEYVLTTDVTDINPDTHKIIDGKIVEYTKPVDTTLLTLQIRAKRNELLAKSDWTQMPDAPLSSDIKQSWATYRASLRDLMQTLTDPTTVVWPQPPAKS